MELKEDIAQNFFCNGILNNAFSVHQYGIFKNYNFENPYSIA